MSALSLNIATSLLAPEGNKETFLGEIQTFLKSPRMPYLNCVNQKPPQAKRSTVRVAKSGRWLRKGPLMFTYVNSHLPIKKGKWKSWLPDVELHKPETKEVILDGSLLRLSGPHSNTDVESLYFSPSSLLPTYHELSTGLLQWFFFFFK